MASFAASHFSRATVKALARKGISVYGTQYLPDMSSDMPFANGETGYKLNDNGMSRIVRFTDVLALAQ